MESVQGVGRVARVEGERFGREFRKDPGKREETPLFDPTPLFFFCCCCLAQKTK